jgi:hypothetical protein
MPLKTSSGRINNAGVSKNTNAEDEGRQEGRLIRGLYIDKRLFLYVDLHNQT